MNLNTFRKPCVYVVGYQNGGHYQSLQRDDGKEEKKVRVQGATVSVGKNRPASETCAVRPTVVSLSWQCARQLTCGSAIMRLKPWCLWRTNADCHDGGCCSGQSSAAAVRTNGHKASNETVNLENGKTGMSGKSGQATAARILVRPNGNYDTDPAQPSYRQVRNWQAGMTTTHGGRCGSQRNPAGGTRRLRKSPGTAKAGSR